MAKAMLLLSGGLDSSLAGKMLLEQGIALEAVNFVSPFCCCTPHTWGCSAARRAAEQLGIQVHVFATGPAYLEVMKHPRFGRGSGMNACLDCRTFMFSRARGFMHERGADFLVTGEVLGERPMSQRRRAMELIERESGLLGRIVRPLCAKHLPPSAPEREGLVDRDRLLDIHGRSRRPQIALARTLGITDYPCPAGGCLLTDPEFAVRFRDLLEHEPHFGEADARVLRHGRHFRLPTGTKVVVGRNQADSEAVERAARPPDVLLLPHGVTGPSVLCRGDAREDVRRAAALLATYTKKGIEMAVAVRPAGSDEAGAVLRRVRPMGRAQAAAWRVGADRRPSAHPQEVEA